MLENIPMSGMQPQAIDDTGMAFGIVHDHVVPAANGIYRTHNTLITIVEQGCVFFSFEFGEFLFQLLVVIAVPAHHSGAHWGRHSKTRSGFRIHFPDLLMVGQAKIIVKTPNYLLFSAKNHSAADLPFQLRDGKITMCALSVLTDRPVVLH